MTKIAEIAQLGAEVLRQQAQPVTDVHIAETQQTINTLNITLASTEGVGIAAPQISISRQIIIIASRPTARYPDAPVMKPTVMINPSFKSLSGTREKDWEGCLSVPGIRALVPRYQSIEVHYSDPLGQLLETRLDGFIARVFQHEYDHLLGLVFLDRVEDNRDIISETEFLKWQQH
jgi:peptide deformylase